MTDRQYSPGARDRYECFLGEVDLGRSMIDVDNAVMAMERTGIGIDAEFFASAAEQARRDEVEKLEALRKFIPMSFWYNEDGGFALPDQFPDSTWSSNPRLKRLFHHTYGWPKSPVKKKGKVDLAKGKCSLDEKATDWIKKTVPESAPLINALIDLKRTRSSMKYLVKFPTFVAPDGLIHTVFGPAGDDDVVDGRERVGAVTWRLAAKNPELHQLPKNKKKDRYRVRRGFVCGPTPWKPEGPSGFRLALQVHDEMVTRGRDKDGKEWIVAGDYMALEVVGLAHLCKIVFGDNQLAEMVDPSAPDIHNTNARKIFGDILGWKHPVTGRLVSEYPLEAFKCDEDPKQEDPHCCYLRDLIKEVWYGMQYGKDKEGFGSSLIGADGLPIGPAKADAFVQGVKKAVPAIGKYQSFVRNWVETRGGIVGISGAWRDCHDLVFGDKDSEWKRRADKDRAYRQCLNDPMQNMGAVIIGGAMVDAARSPLMAGALTADEAMVILKDIMEGAYRLSIPLRAKTGKGVNYDACK